MTRDEAAAMLNNCQYRAEISRDFARRMKEDGLVAVYGASDDLLEFDGAIREEISAYDGTTAYLTSKGLLENDCDNDDCPHFEKLKKRAVTIEAVWDEDGYSWIYRTEIPHSVFDVMEDDEPYCRGIIFALADVKEPT